MSSVLFFKFRFIPSWFMSIISLLFIILFIMLGFWQISRAHEKEMMLFHKNQQKLVPPVFWQPSDALPKQYQPIKVTGKFLKPIMLLDNQHNHHQFGYNVLSPLQFKNGSIIIVDRGWVRGDPGRLKFPLIDIPETEMQLMGSVYFPSKKQWVLGPEIEKKNVDLVIIERFNAQLLSQILQKSVYPFIIRLDEKNTHGFVREWETVSMPPERHCAYAVQWFSMAIIVLVLFIALNLKKNDEKSSL